MEKTVAKPRSRAKKAAAPDLQHEKIAIAAYYLSEARGFEPGHELEDWLQAEANLAPRPKAPRKYVRVKKTAIS